MKKRLKIIAGIFLGFVIASPIFSHAEEADKTDDPQAVVESIIDNSGDGEWTEGTYKTGSYHINPAWEKQKDGKIIEQVTGIGGQITKSAANVTNDPQAANYAAAGGSFLGALGSVAATGYYFDLANTYDTAQDENERLHSANEEELEKVNRAIEEERTRHAEANESETAAIEEKIEKLESEKKDIEKNMRTQERLSSEYGNADLGYSALSLASLTNAGMMSWTGTMQLKEAKKLGDADGEIQPQALPKGPEDTQLGPRMPVSESPGFENAGSSDKNDSGFGNIDFDGGALSDSAGSGKGVGDSAESFLTPGGGASGGNFSSKKDGKSDGEMSERSLSSDQSYGGSGAAALDAYGSAEKFSVAGAPGFDISRFLPAHLRGEEQGGFFIKQVNEENAKEKKSIILGKQSPSLFTRISRAHQKKAHELAQELF